jgi:hypothetical protein
MDHLSWNLQGRFARHKDDAAPVAALHARQVIAAQADSAQHVHFEKTKPIFIRDLLERLGLKDTEIVDENIDCGKLPRCFLNGSGRAEVGGEALNVSGA